MSALAILASSLLAVPVLDDGLHSRMLESYPASAVAQKKSAASLIRVVVDPSGKVERCETIGVAGDETLGAFPCTFVEHLRLNAPKAANGDPSFGVVETIMRFVARGTPQAAEALRAVQTPDVSVTIASLPGQAKGPIDLNVLVQVSETGDVTHCEAAREDAAPYAAVICETMRQRGWNRLADNGGAPVAYVTRIRARFMTQPAG